MLGLGAGLAGLGAGLGAGLDAGLAGLGAGLGAGLAVLAAVLAVLDVHLQPGLAVLGPLCALLVRPSLLSCCVRAVSPRSSSLMCVALLAEGAISLNQPALLSS